MRRWPTGATRTATPRFLVGQRLRVFDKSEEGREGVCTNVIQGLGKTTKHEILFDGATEPEQLLLRKKFGTKGVKFHILGSDAHLQAGHET